MGDGNETNTQTTNATQTGPWSVQQPYLDKAFQGANSAYEKTSITPYTGNFVAKPTADQQSIFANILNGANGGAANANSSAAYGVSALGNGLSNAANAQSGLFGIANSNLTQGNIDAASAYANSPYLSGQIDAALTDPRRQLTEQDLPAIDRAAAGTGNVNSSRAGVASGIAQRGYEETAANTAANMRGNAYAQGLSLAQGDTATKAGALTNAGNLGSGLFSLGLSGLGNSANIANTNANTANLASTNVTANNQAGLNNNIQKSDYANQFPWNSLQNFYNIIGGNNWGANGTSQGTSDSTQTPSTLSTVGSVAGILGSLFKSDARAKHLHMIVGETHDGLPLWQFTYKDDPFGSVLVAPLAQDVEQRHPGAVIELNGVKYIDTTAYDWRT